MIEFIFTIDYEIYGDGHGGLRELVYEPAQRLTEVFLGRGIRFVNFVEVAELEKIEDCGTDPAIGLVTRQIRDLFAADFEIGLHLHPQWCNARYERTRWLLDFSEYNLCTLSRPRVTQIIDRSLDYLRGVVASPGFTPLSFRAGNWLFQPTQPAGGVLAEHGLRVDSSVFKGGLQRSAGLDYRRSRKNPDYWRFEADVNEPDPSGSMTELPIWVEMVPFWKMLTAKRMGFRNNLGRKSSSTTSRAGRLSDFLRMRYPLKLDFCRMTIEELTGMMERIISRDRRDPDTLRPVVAIGHTKDLHDLATVEQFLAYLEAKHIPVVTFRDVYPRLPNSPNTR